MKVNNTQPQLHFGNLNVSKYIKAGEKIIKVPLGTIQTTKKFDRDVLDILKESRYWGTFDLPDELHPKLNNLIQSVVEITWANKSQKKIGLAEDYAEIMDKDCSKNGGYYLVLKA